MTASREFLVDSSGWLEYVTADVNASLFAPYIEAPEPLIVPTIVLYEVHKKLLIDQGKTFADRFSSHALRHILVPLDEMLALAAARVSVDLHLYMADAIIFAAAESRNAEIVTSDSHFRGVPHVIFI